MMPAHWIQWKGMLTLERVSFHNLGFNLTINAKGYDQITELK